MAPKGKRKLTVSLLLGAALTAALAAYLATASEYRAKALTSKKIKQSQKVTPQQRPKVDVVFVLDTTGSMGGLIEGAKRKIWAIANRIMTGQPRPDLRIGLIGYRDKGDAYVTRRFEFSENIDDVYSNLLSFQASGGGDTPEHVNRALDEALHKMRWRKGERVLRQIYLVGDAPPHEGRDGLFSSKLAQSAKQRGIIINAIRCGSMQSTKFAWQRIAQASNGIYASIRQDGGMRVVATPMDSKLARLNEMLSKTALFAGKEGERKAAHRRALSNAGMSGYAKAESARYRALSGKLDTSDLLTKLDKGKKLSDFRRKDLPAPMQAMKPAEQKAYVVKIRKRRAQISKQILELSNKRAKYLRKHAKKPAGGAFDSTVTKALRAQGAKANIAY
jgi:Mg-chelatase subunit ChlD